MIHRFKMAIEAVIKVDEAQVERNGNDTRAYAYTLYRTFLCGIWQCRVATATLLGLSVRISVIWEFTSSFISLDRFELRSTQVFVYSNKSSLAPPSL